MEKEIRFKIGRDEDCEVPIADASVSRLHAQLSLLDGGRLFLTDCGSTNGTRLIRKGRVIHVRQEFVEPGDTLCFGDVDLGLDEILDVIQAANPLPADRIQAPEPDSRIRPQTGGRLLRCVCGTVKPKGGTCPTCGK